MRGSANSAKVKVKGKPNFTEGKASKNSPNHSSKKKSYFQKSGGKKHWQGHKGQQHDSQESHYQSSTSNYKGSPKEYHGGGGERHVSRGGTSSSDRERSRSPEQRGKRSGPPICTICDRPGHTADRCFSYPNSYSYRGKSSAKAVMRRITILPR